MIILMRPSRPCELFCSEHISHLNRTDMHKWEDVYNLFNEHAAPWAHPSKPEPWLLRWDTACREKCARETGCVCVCVRMLRRCTKTQAVCLQGVCIYTSIPVAFWCVTSECLWWEAQSIWVNVFSRRLKKKSPAEGSLKNVSSGPPHPCTYPRPSTPLV